MDLTNLIAWAIHFAHLVLICGVLTGAIAEAIRHNDLHTRISHLRQKRRRYLRAEATRRRLGLPQLRQSRKKACTHFDPRPRPLAFSQTGLTPTA